MVVYRKFMMPCSIFLLERKEFHCSVFHYKDLPIPFLSKVINLRSENTISLIKNRSIFCVANDYKRCIILFEVIEKYEVLSSQIRAIGDLSLSRHREDERQRYPTCRKIHLIEGKRYNQDSKLLLVQIGP